MLLTTWRGSGTPTGATQRKDTEEYSYSNKDKCKLMSSDNEIKVDDDIVPVDPQLLFQFVIFYTRYKIGQRGYWIINLFVQYESQDRGTI